MRARACRKYLAVTQLALYGQWVPVLRCHQWWAQQQHSANINNHHHHHNVLLVDHCMAQQQQQTTIDAIVYFVPLRVTT